MYDFSIFMVFIFQFKFFYVIFIFIFFLMKKSEVNSKVASAKCADLWI